MKNIESITLNNLLFEPRKQTNKFVIEGDIINNNGIISNFENGQIYLDLYNTFTDIFELQLKIKLPTIKNLASNQAFFTLYDKTKNIENYYSLIFGLTGGTDANDYDIWSYGRPNNSWTLYNCYFKNNFKNLNIFENEWFYAYVKINGSDLTSSIYDKDKTNEWRLPKQNSYIKYGFNRLYLGGQGHGYTLYQNSYIDLNYSYILIYDSKYRLSTLL